MSMVVVLHRDRMDCYFSDRDTAASVPLAAPAVQDMEIGDEQALSVALRKGLGAKTPHQAVPSVICIADDLCFYKKGDPAADMKAQQETLMQDAPFTRVATTALITKDTTLLIATNMDLYETVAQFLGELGYPVSLVFPQVALTLVSVNGQGPLDRTAVKKISDEQQTLDPVRFPCEHQKKEEAAGTATAVPASGKKKLPIGWIIFISLALIYAAVMGWIFIFKQ